MTIRGVDARRGERGAVGVELALLVPVLMLILSLTMLGARLWQARTDLTAAAASAARLASHSTAGQVDAAIRSLVAEELETLDTPCASVQVHTSTLALSSHPGVGGRVEVEISCQVALADLLIVGVPGTITVRASAGEVIDTFRER